MPADKPTELSRIKLNTWIRQPVPMISKHSANSTSQPVGFRTWLWRYTCLLLLISMLWHRQAIFESKRDKLSTSAECRDSNSGSQTPNRQQTKCPLTNRLSYRGSSYKLERDSPPLWSAIIQPTRCWLSRLALAIHTFVINLHALVQAGDIRIERRQVVYLYWMPDWNSGSQTPNRRQSEPPLANRLSYRGSCY